MFRHPDAEELLIAYLGPMLGVPVGVKGLNAPAFVKVIRTGGPRIIPVLDQPQITFEVYAIRGSTAWDLADSARMAVFALAGTTLLGGASVKEVLEVGGPANLPDPIFPDHTRYTFTLAVHLRGWRQEP